MNAIELDPANARRTDPLTRKAARYPHEHAPPAVYAQSIEGPGNIGRGDLLHRIMVVICVLSVAGAAGIAVLEIWLRRSA